MSKNLKRIIFLIFSTILIIIFISLGFWQLKRKAYKQELIEIINQQISLSEVPYSNSVEDKLYRHFKFSGSFNNKDRIFVYGSNEKNGNNGYFILTPFLMDNGNSTLVIRGWTKNIDPYIEMEDKNSFSGILIKPSKSGFFTPNPDLKANIFYSFDIERIKKSLNIDIEDFMVIAISDTNLVKPSLKKFIYVYNMHIEYIFTWFTLAIFTFIILVLNRKKL
jgi:surfeit locus 1 family protein